MRILNKFITKLQFLALSLDRRIATLDTEKKDNDAGFLKWRNWENVASKWDVYTSPFRPSEGDINNYERILKKLYKKEKILILGSTPELRDICVKTNARVIVADFSSSMIKEMRRFSENSSAWREKWVIGDWLSLNNFFENNYFDVILGDLVLRNIEKEKQEKFLYIVSKLLTNKGFFITRIHFINEDLLKSDANFIIKDAFDKYLFWGQRLLEDLITSRLFDKNTNFDTKEINKNSFFADVNDYLRKSARNEEEKFILKNILKKWGGKMTWTQRTSKEIDDLLANYFTIRDLKIAFDYQDSEFYPVYLLEKR